MDEDLDMVVEGIESRRLVEVEEVLAVRGQDGTVAQTHSSHSVHIKWWPCHVRRISACGEQLRDVPMLSPVGLRQPQDWQIHLQIRGCNHYPENNGDSVDSHY